MRLFIYLILILFVSCRSHSTDEEIINRLQNKLKSINKNSIINLKASIRSTNYNDTRLIVSHYNRESLGAIIIKIDYTGVTSLKKKSKKCALHISKQTLNDLGKCFYQTGITSIAIDSSLNIYISTSATDKYNYAIAYNFETLDKQYNYKMYKNNCYTINN